MGDKRLLALAAQAAEYDVRWHDNWQCFVHAKPFNTDNPPTLAGQRLVWSPLTDDGDAFRLAVKLKFSVTVFDDAIGIGCKSLPEGARYGEYPIDADPYAATRRAIVRAAAAIANQEDDNGS